VENIVGLNIRQERERLNLRLRKLAKDINVSASLLSQIETGKVNPSLATLKKIADTLHTTIGKLIGEDESIYNIPIVKKKDRILLDNMGHGINIELLAYQDINNQLQPYIINFKQKADTGGLNKHAGQEFGLIIKGNIEINLNGKKHILTVGDSFYFNANIPHSMKNIFRGESQVLIVATPPLF